LENLEKVQGELNMVNDKASAEIIEIEKKYNEQRKPFFEKRQECIEGIPNFWLTVVNFTFSC
jgi:template-activating factor I